MAGACTDKPVAKAPARETAAAAIVIPAPASPTPRSPDRYRVRFETSQGPFVLEVTRARAPHGADRLHELVAIGYFSGVRFFRMVPGFVVQFGIHGDPAVNAVWDTATIPDDPARTGNVRGTVAFAASGADSRATQLFVSTGDNVSKLDRQRLFTPLGRVVEGMDVVDKLNSEYGEEPNPSRAVRQGNAYFSRWFPALDSIVRATIVSDSSRARS
jgi:cyclophilin family peptidyl-prolyl cis-trans isomerase